jgi:transposase
MRALQVERFGAEQELKAALRQASRPVDQLRIRAVLAVTKGHRIPSVVKMLSVGERALHQWVHRYTRRGVEGLRDGRKGRSCRLNRGQQEQLKQRILSGPAPSDGVCSLRGNDIRHILETDFGVTYKRSSVYYLLRYQLDMSYLKPRPLHPKGDPAAKEDFKKSFRTPSTASVKSILAGGWKSGSRTKAASASKVR